MPVAWIGVICGLLILEPDSHDPSHCAVGCFWRCRRHAVDLAKCDGLVGQGIHRGGSARSREADRVLAFLKPDLNPAVAYQLAQSKMAYVKEAGSELASEQHPEAALSARGHTDFILAIIERNGLAGHARNRSLVLGVLVCAWSSATALPTASESCCPSIHHDLVLQAVITSGGHGCMPTKAFVTVHQLRRSSLVLSVASWSLAEHRRPLRRRASDRHTRRVRTRCITPDPVAAGRRLVTVRVLPSGNLPLPA